MADYIKYKKLKQHDPDDGKRKHISPYIENSFVGEDHIRGEKEIIITEGMPDWISAVDKGFAAVSPVTTRFKDDDIKRLAEITAGAESIYIINDNETNQAGYKGALETGKYLSKTGKNIYLVELPRPEGKDKIDLNEYLRDHTADELRDLMSESKTVLEILIDSLPEDLPKALPELRNDILPILIELDGTLQDYYSKLSSQKIGSTVPNIKKEIEQAKKRKAEKEKAEDVKPVDPEILKQAEQIAKDPGLLKKRIDLVNLSGIVGERNVIAMIFACMDSRLLPDDNVNPNTLNVKIAGHSGSGKSCIVKSCLTLYPESVYKLITSASEKALYRMSTDMKHKALIFAEGFQFQSNNGQDSEMVYTVRCLLSEGRVSYLVTEKKEDGTLETAERKLEGPTSFLTTTIKEKLEDQLEDRLFTIHPDESMEQSMNIIRASANRKAGLIYEIDIKTINAWKTFHENLNPIQIVIPYAPAIADYINKNGKPPISIRRAYNRVLSVIQAITCAYQHQRKTDTNNRKVAEIADYWMALQIVKEAFKENLGQQNIKNNKRIEHIRDNEPVNYNELKAVWGISKPAVSQWVSARIKEGVLVRCDDCGNELDGSSESRSLIKSGKSYVKVSDEYADDEAIGLPSPYELSGDDEWSASGKQLHKYDLKIDHQVLSSIKPVLNDQLNTSDEDERVNNISDSDDTDAGIKVLSEDPEDNDNIIELNEKKQIVDDEDELMEWLGLGTSKNRKSASS